MPMKEGEVSISQVKYVLIIIALCVAACTSHSLQTEDAESNGARTSFSQFCEREYRSQVHVADYAKFATFIQSLAARDNADLMRKVLESDQADALFGHSTALFRSNGAVKNAVNKNFAKFQFITDDGVMLSAAINPDFPSESGLIEAMYLKENPEGIYTWENQVFASNGSPPVEPIDCVQCHGSYKNPAGRKESLPIWFSYPRNAGEWPSGTRDVAEKSTHPIHDWTKGAAHIQALRESTERKLYGRSLTFGHLITYYNLFRIASQIKHSRIWEQMPEAIVAALVECNQPEAFVRDRRVNVAARLQVIKDHIDEIIDRRTEHWKREGARAGVAEPDSDYEGTGEHTDGRVLAFLTYLLEEHIPSNIRVSEWSLDRDPSAEVMESYGHKTEEIEGVGVMACFLIPELIQERSEFQFLDKLSGDNLQSDLIGLKENYAVCDQLRTLVNQKESQKGMTISQ